MEKIINDLVTYSKAFIGEPPEDLEKMFMELKTGLKEKGILPLAFGYDGKNLTIEESVCLN